MTRRPQLDAIRGAAALAIVVYHLWVVPADATGLLWLYAAQLWVAVPVFFALSGFLIHAQLESRDVGSFYAARFGRVVPLWLIVALGSAAVVGTDGLPWWCWICPQLWQALGMHPPIAIGPMWSVSIEAAFYAVAPRLRR